MYTKIIFSVVLMAFMAVQMAQGNGTKAPLQCITCNTTSCKLPKLQNCDQRAANSTRKELSQYFYDVEYLVVSNEYQCLSTSYKRNNVTVMSLSGCVNFDPCYLHPYNTTWKKDHCNLCKDKNGCNPAGTFSVSTSVMILSVVSLVLVKLFDM